MKATITETPHPSGTGYDWTLEVTKKVQVNNQRQEVTRKFWLGRDELVTERLLGLLPRELSDKIGNGPEAKQKLADLVLIEIFGDLKQASKLFMKVKETSFQIK